MLIILRKNMPLELADKFSLTKRVYAIMPETFESISSGGVFNHETDSMRTSVYNMMTAMYFVKRRSNKRIAACIGTLVSIDTVNSDVDITSDEYIANTIRTAQWNPNPRGVWDEVEEWWTDVYASDANLQAEALPKLKDMLNDYPNIPSYASGWYKVS
jgi:hypothetical protein